MSWYRRLISRVVPFSTDEDSNFEEVTGLDLYNTNDKADDVFKNSVPGGIRYDSTKQVSQVALEDDNSVIGALASGWSPGGDYGEDKVMQYGFDLAVHPEHRRKGVAKALIENAIKVYESEKVAYEEMGYKTCIKVHAVNPIMIQTLEKHYGFNVEAVYREDENGEPIDAHLVRY